MNNVVDITHMIIKRKVKELESTNIRENYIFHDCHRCGAHGGVMQHKIKEAALLEKECQYCKKTVAIW